MRGSLLKEDPGKYYQLIKSVLGFLIILSKYYISNNPFAELN